jgi:hypothetical protein
MVIAIILPTIGFTMLAAALIFIGVDISPDIFGIETDLWVVLGIWLFFTFIQLMFLVMSASNRPPVDME